MSFDGEMLWNGFAFELVQNGGGHFCLTRFSEDRDREMAIFFDGTSDMEEQGDIELLADVGGETGTVGMVRSDAPEGLLEELREL